MGFAVVFAFFCGFFFFVAEAAGLAEVEGVVVLSFFFYH